MKYFIYNNLNQTLIVYISSYFKMSSTQAQILNEATIYYADGSIEKISTNQKKFSLELLQNYVKGRIQVSKLDKNLDYIFNEEGRLHRLPQNPHFPQFLGNVIVINHKFY